MQSNKQKQWKKTLLAAIGLMTYSILTTFSYGDMFPSELVLKKSGIAWESAPDNTREEKYYGKNYTLYLVMPISISKVSNGGYWGSLDGYYGIVFPAGFVITLSGTASTANGVYNLQSNFQDQGEPIVSGSNEASVKKNTANSAYSASFLHDSILNLPAASTSKSQNTNLRAAIYISKSMKPGIYKIDQSISLSTGLSYINIVNNGGVSLIYTPEIQCTINTPPKIDFGRVNIWEWEGNTGGAPGGNRKDVLGYVDGNFAINCTGNNDARVPAKLTIKGPIQTYANDLKMTMDATGELAPATIRASIKSIIEPCKTGGTSFGSGNNTPPSNEVNLGELTVGQNLVPYRFSLCSLGEGFKSGAASASATVTIDWE